MLQEIGALVQAVGQIAHRFVYVCNDSVDIACGRRSLGSKFSDFVGNDRKTASGLSRPCGFNGSVQSQKICLAGNVQNRLCQLIDFLNRFGLFHCFFCFTADFFVHDGSLACRRIGGGFQVIGTVFAFRRSREDFFGTFFDDAGTFSDIAKHLIDIFHCRRGLFHRRGKFLCRV